MKRYSTTRQRLDKAGMRVYSTTFYPQIPISDSDQFIYPKDGDRLDTLAYRYYGDTTLWWVIAKANGIKGKVAVSVDDVLRIPGNISIIMENFRRINNNGY
tara:strand:+ start:934 stop:1236 length:303 start_codon:yes stop_codon:yes gene_type:complete